uniref:Uncharacterized protein LOC113791400 n=1 Tax=Dermatophagoides pteronyssinus TaxID=6956 RepID=A0A6P6XVJ1_DERPT|nr:uncharacterized protein LOC113791400 [Dermatophagoides pteronyssinus]
MASSPTTLSEALDYLRKLINIHGNTKITINDHKDNFQKIITIVEDATSTSSDKSEENERLCSLFDQQQKELEKSIEENEQLKDLSNQQQKEIVNLKDEIIRVKAQNYDKIIGKAVNSIGTVQTSKSYSDMVKANISEQINSTRRSNHVVIISPKEDSISKDSNQTVAIAKEKINIKTTIDNGLRIEKFQPASSRKCIIKCNSEKDVEKICCILKDDDMILAKKPVKKNPRIMIVGISKDISRKEIVAFIIAQNPNVASLLEQDKKEFMKIIFDKEDRVGTKFAILETSPKKRLPQPLNTTIMDEPIIILCQNVQHSRAGTQQILINAELYRSPVLCIQEPYTFSDRVCGLTGYSVLSSPNPKSVIATTLPNLLLIQQFTTTNCSSSKEIAFYNRRSKHLESACEVNDLVNSLTDTIITICERTLPPKRSGKRSIYWFTDELKEKNQLCKRLRRKWKRSNNQFLREVYLNQYIICVKEYKFQLIAAKKKSIREFFTIQDSSSVWKQVYKWCKSPANLNQSLKSIKTEHGWTTTPLDTANHLLNKFFPNDPPDNHTQSLISSAAQTACTAPDDVLFSLEEVNDAIQTENDNKSPGEDAISANIIKHISYLFPELFLNIFNACLKFAIFPDRWKISIVKVIPKPGSNLQTAKAFRPISLLSVTGKILEKLIYKRLLFWIYKHPTGLSNQQYGFRPQRSTEDAINIIVSKRKEILNNNKFGLFVSLDVAGAFDSAWWSLILVSLKKFDIPNNLIDILKSYFTNRKAKLSICGETSEKSLSRGCPQGAKCSPLLWNILYDNLLQLRLPNDCYIQAFADDAFLIVSHENLDICENRANKALEKISKWGEDNKIEFNPSKTQAMLVTKRRKTRQIDLKMKGVTIDIVKHMKYLGVIIENKNKWNQHLDLISNKTRRLYHQILRTTGKEWGLSSEVRRTIYISAIEPILTYACSSWQDVELIFCFARFEDSYVSSKRLSIIKGYRTISTDAATVLANIEPIDLKILYCSNRYFLKKGTPSIGNFPIASFQIRAPFSFRPHPANNTNISIENCQKSHTIDIFTDGSKIANQVGSAFVAMRESAIIHTGKKRLANECTVFQAELLAILSATHWCIEQDLDAKIHCDSQAAINAVCSRNTSDSLALKIQKSIQNSTTHICITWVKAHVGILGNELADSLAKKATENASIDYELIPTSHGLKIAKIKLNKDWDERWTTSLKGRTTASFFPTINDRKQCKFIPNYIQTQFLSGHGKFATYLNKMNIQTSDRCTCGEQQTVEHVVLHCPATIYARHLTELRMGHELKSLKMDKRNLEELLDYFMQAYKIL